MVFVHQQISSKEGSTFDPSTHNHNLLKANKYNESLMELITGASGSLGSEEQLDCASRLLVSLRVTEICTGLC